MSSTGYGRRGTGLPTPGSTRARSPRRERNPSVPVVPLREGNRVWWDERKESHSAVVPEKTGNSPRRTRWRKGRCRRTEPVRGTRGSTPWLHYLSPSLHRIASEVFGRPLRRYFDRTANPSVDEPDALIAHVRICGRRGA